MQFMAEITKKCNKINSYISEMTMFATQKLHFSSISVGYERGSTAPSRPRVVHDFTKHSFTLQSLYKQKSVLS